MRRSFAIALVAGIGGLVLGMQTTKVATAQATNSPQTYTGTGVQGWHQLEAINLSFANAPAKGYMVRSYLDPNTNCYVYVTENGAIACTPAPAK